MENRFRGKNFFANQHHRNVVFIPTPVVTSSLESGTTTARLYSVTLVVPNDVGVGSTGNRRATVWPFYMTTDSDGYFPTASANLTASSQGSTVIGGSIIPNSTLNFSRGILITNSTGHVIAAFTASTGALTTSYIQLVKPDGTKLPAVALTLT